jgi:hypothetical protein
VQHNGDTNDRAHGVGRCVLDWSTLCLSVGALGAAAGRTVPFSVCGFWCRARQRAPVADKKRAHRAKGRKENADSDRASCATLLIHCHRRLVSASHSRAALFGVHRGIRKFPAVSVPSWPN